MSTQPDLDPEPVPIALVLGEARLVGRLRVLATRHAVARYMQGLSIRGIAGELERPYTTVRRLLSEAEVNLRARGGRRSSTWGPGGRRAPPCSGAGPPTS